MQGQSCGEMVANSCVKTAESSEMSPDQLDLFMVDWTLIRFLSPCRMDDLMLSVHSTKLITHNPSAPCNSITMAPAWTESFIQRSGGLILGTVLETNMRDQSSIKNCNDTSIIYSTNRTESFFPVHFWPLMTDYDRQVEIIHYRI